MADLTPDAATGTVQALQDVLAAEHAAVWVLGFLGARVSATAQPELAARLTAAFKAHREARDELSDLLDERGVAPVASQPDYELPSPTMTPAQLEAAALAVEQAVTSSYAAGVRSTAGEDRRWTLAGLQAGAVRQLGLGGSPSDLPGLD